LQTFGIEISISKHTEHRFVAYHNWIQIVRRKIFCTNQYYFQW